VYASYMTILEDTKIAQKESICCPYPHIWTTHSLQLRYIVDGWELSVFTCLNMQKQATTRNEEVAIFWDIASCSPYVNRRFGGMYYPHV
jgi:hypothetical protein